LACLRHWPQGLPRQLDELALARGDGRIASRLKSERCAPINRNGCGWLKSAVGYAGRLVHWSADRTHTTLEIIRRGHTKGFEVLLQRWVVERTFAWIFKNRRLVRDYEQLIAVAETLITIAASATMLRRWA
jgi:transposase